MSVQRLFLAVGLTLFSSSLSMGCEAEAPAAFTANLDATIHLDGPTKAGLTRLNTHHQSAALPDGLRAKVVFDSAKDKVGARYVTSVAVTVEDTKGWALSVGLPAPPTNVGPGTGKDAVMQTGLIVTQSKVSGVKTLSRGTKIDIRADGTIEAK